MTGARRTRTFPGQRGTFVRGVGLVSVSERGPALPDPLLAVGRGSIPPSCAGREQADRMGKGSVPAASLRPTSWHRIEEDRFSLALPEPPASWKTAARARQGKVQLQPRSRGLGRRISPGGCKDPQNPRIWLLPLAFRQESPAAGPKHARDTHPHPERPPRGSRGGAGGRHPRPAA